jgi:GDPmannose 4,6-dehydratase
MSKLALITGITGQDGSYLAEFLLGKNYKVVGLHRRNSNPNYSRIINILDNPNFVLEEFDLSDPSGCNRVVEKYQPHELYNLAAQSHVGTSFQQPSTTVSFNTLGVVNLLESIKTLSPLTKLYQASTSEMFGRNYSTNNNGIKYQDENTVMLPQSPYGVAKLASHHLIAIYRSSYNLFCSSGILFNHESPRRGDNFVTRKITKYIGQLVNKKNVGRLQLGNLDAVRDWGHAEDYVRGMWLMLQQENPDDYVLSTGTTHSVKEFLEIAFSSINLNYKNHIDINSDLFRPAEVDYLCGNSAKAQTILNWSRQHTFESLISDMVQSDINYYAS